MNWKESVVLVTGGTGFFGRQFIDAALRELQPKKLIVFSRDEHKQHEMRQAHLDQRDLRYFIGDIRDRVRLHRALRGVDVVIHAAAMKHVPACEYNPGEAVKTNVDGAQNIIDAAIDCGVKKVLALSTDKAVNPVNLYGATKLCAEKLFVQGNSYSGGKGTQFSCTRYGNVAGSRGSVVGIFNRQRGSGTITVTDKRMTRFWMTPEQAVRFVIDSIEKMRGGEVFVPKCPSMRITDLAEALAPGCKLELVGIRPGEKLHEVLISADESRCAVEFDGGFLIEPLRPWWTPSIPPDAERLPEGTTYASDTNDHWLSVEDLRRELTHKP